MEPLATLRIIIAIKANTWKLLRCIIALLNWPPLSVTDYNNLGISYNFLGLYEQSISSSLYEFICNLS